MRLDDFLSQNTETKAFKKGEVIFHEGEEAVAAYYVIAGAVDIFKEPAASLAVLGAGQIFGEMAILRFDKYTLSARAAEDTSLYVITPGILQEQLRAAHPLIRAMLDMLAERVHGVNEVLIDLDSTNQA